MQARTDIAVEDLCAASVQVIDDPEDGTLVARDHLGAEGHDVTVLDVDHIVLANGGPGQRGARFPLRTGNDRHTVMPRIGIEVKWLDQGSRRNAQHAEIHGDVAGAIEAPADQGDLAAMGYRPVHDLLHPVDGRRRNR